MDFGTILQLSDVISISKMSLFLLFIKYFILMIIGLKVYDVLYDVLRNLVDKEELAFVISLLSTLALVYFIRSFFLGLGIIALVVVLVVVYFAGGITSALALIGLSGSIGKRK